MIDVTTNPTLDLLQAIIWVAVALVSILVVIVGFFIKKDYSRQEFHFNKLECVVNTVKETADNLKTIVEVIKARQLGDGEVCRQRHHDNLERIVILEDDVAEIGDRMTAVETKCKMHHEK